MCRVIKLTGFGFVLGVAIVVAAHRCTIQPEPCFGSSVSITTLGCTK